MKNFTVQFYERNCVSVQDTVKQVQDMLEEGFDYESHSVQVDYSDTQEVFTVYEDK
jgi:predicted RNase H-like nuclease (RuvC/YqgF family)